MIRPSRPEDLDGIVELSLAAWQPVFGSMREVLGDDLFERFWPEWRSDQAAAVRAAVAANETWVAIGGSSVVGFVNVVFDDATASGEIHMIAVDPSSQRSGVASALTEFAIDEMRSRGITLVTVSTGGDPGHAPARRTYEAAGFTAFPQVLYARLIDPPSG